MILSENNKVLSIKPNFSGGYKTDLEYYIILKKDISSSSKNYLKKDLIITFIVEETDEKPTISNISIGDNENRIIDAIGKPDRIDYGDAGSSWYTYNKDLKDYVLIYLNKNKVVSIYTTSDYFLQSYGISVGMTSKQVEEILKDEKKLRDFYLIDDNAVKFYYDSFNDNKLMGLMIGYSDTNKNEPIINELTLRNYERQVSDLANVARVQNGLKALAFDENMAKVAREHSKEMNDNNYFSHIGLDGSRPGDRLSRNDIKFWSCGENIAAGYRNPIEVNDGWMNSEGHRKNILYNFNKIGVGIVSSGSYSMPYYTQIFITQ